jgi:hypothetical protein
MSGDKLQEIMQNTPWCDVELHGVSWAESGRDVIFHMYLPVDLTGDRNRWLVCRWAHGLVVQLTYAQGHGGFPLTWGATFARHDDGTLTVRFDFGASGELWLTCNDLEFMPDPNS